MYLTKNEENNSIEATRFTFSKEERLCHLKSISQLLKGGATVFVPPLKFTYLPVTPHTPSPYPAQVLIIASKRIFKTAPARNAVKRRLRECYRVCKPAFYTALQQKNMHLHIAVFYTKSAETQHEELKKAMQAGLDKIISRLQTLPPTAEKTNSSENTAGTA